MFRLSLEYYHLKDHFECKQWSSDLKRSSGLFLLKLKKSSNRFVHNLWTPRMDMICFPIVNETFGNSEKLFESLHTKYQQDKYYFLLEEFKNSKWLYVVNSKTTPKTILHQKPAVLSTLKAVLQFVDFCVYRTHPLQIICRAWSVSLRISSKSWNCQHTNIPNFCLKTVPQMSLASFHSTTYGVNRWSSLAWLFSYWKVCFLVISSEKIQVDYGYSETSNKLVSLYLSKINIEDKHWECLRTSLI